MTPVLGSKILALALGVVLLAGCAAREQTYTDPDTGLKVTPPAGFVMGKALPLNSGGTAEVSFASAEEPSITIEVARDWVKNSTGPAFADKTFAQRELPSNSAEGDMRYEKFGQGELWTVEHGTASANSDMTYLSAFYVPAGAPGRGQPKDYGYWRFRLSSPKSEQARLSGIRRQLLDTFSPPNQSTSFPKP